MVRLAEKADSCKQENDDATKVVDTIVDQIRMICESKVRDTLKVACGKTGLNAKEAALVKVQQEINQVINDICMSQEQGYKGPRTTCPNCGKEARFVRYLRKEYVTLAGRLSMSRAYYTMSAWTGPTVGTVGVR